MSRVKTYKHFMNEEVLALPPHTPTNIPEVNDSKMKYSLRTLYTLEHYDIVATAKRIISILDSGTYLRVYDRKYKLNHFYQNEPIEIFGIKGGKSVTAGTYKDIKCTNDSLVIYSKSHDSLFVIDFNAFDHTELTFVRPKKVITEHDPYGEEDWNE